MSYRTRGNFRPSIRPSVRPSIRPSVRLYVIPSVRPPAGLGGPQRASDTLYPAVHIVGSLDVYSRAKRIADH